MIIELSVCYFYLVFCIVSTFFFSSFTSMLNCSYLDTNYNVLYGE